MFSGIVQLAARRALNPKMKVRLLLPQPIFKRKLKGTSIDSMKNKEEAPAYRLATINGRPSDSRR